MILALSPLPVEAAGVCEFAVGAGMAAGMAGIVGFFGSRETVFVFAPATIVGGLWL